MSSGKYAANIVSVLVLSGLALGADTIRKELHFKVGKHPMVSINNTFGPVVVKAGVMHQVAIVALLHSEKIELDESKSRDRVEVTSHLMGADRNSGIVEYQVQVPPDANVTIHSDSGRIHAEKLGGDVIVAGNDGPIEVADCAGGHVHVRTLNGSVNLNNVHGHVEIMSVGGDVVMHGVTGTLVAVNSNSGKIEYDGDFGEEGEYAFSSHTGNIDAVAPAYASIEVLARSTNGLVQSDFSLEPRHAPFIVRGANSLSGTMGKAASSSVKLFSFSGKIRLRKRQN
jgi:Putative adhesin